MAGEESRAERETRTIEELIAEKRKERLAASKPKPNGPPPPPAKPERKGCLMIYNGNYPEPAPIIEAILYPGLTILGGRPKVGKSWFALELALSIVSEQKLCRYLTVRKPGRVLYISLEDRERQLRARLRKLSPPSDWMEDLTFIFELPPLMAGGATVIMAELDEHPVEIVVVDSLLALVKQASREKVDAMQADYNIINTLRQIAEKYAVAIILIAHTRKAGGDFLDTIQGTSGTTAAADAVWVLSRTPEGEAKLEVTGRDLESNTFGLKRAEDSGAWIITGEGDEVTQSEARREIIDLLRDQGPIKPTRIATLLRKNISGVHRLLQALCESRLIVRTRYGTYHLPGQPPKDEKD
jgi:hypothetical protein